MNQAKQMHVPKIPWVLRLTFLLFFIAGSTLMLNAQNQEYWREGFTSGPGLCDLSTTNPSSAVSYYFNGANSGVWWGKNIYSTTGTGCPSGNSHVRFRNISGVTDSGEIVTPVVNFGIQEFHFYRARANRDYSVWVTSDTSALTTNWTIVAYIAKSSNGLCADTTIIVGSANAKRLKLKASPGIDSDVDSIMLTSYSAITGGPSPGNIVISRVGNGTQTLSNKSANIVLLQLTPSGTIVDSIPIPFTGTGKLVLQGSSSNDGLITLTPDKQNLVLYGYNADTGISTVSSVAGVQRIVKLVDANKTITDVASGVLTGNARCAAYNGTNAWVVGSSNGVMAGLGIGTGLKDTVTVTQTNLRSVAINNGQLYYSTASGNKGIYRVGNGTPGTGPITATQVIPAAANSNFNQFSFKPDSSVCYVADDAGTAGLRKFTRSGSVWTQTDSISTPFLGRSLCVDWTQTNPIIYVSVGQNVVAKVTDIGSNLSTQTLTTIYTAPTNMGVRGISIAPTGSVTPPPPAVAANVTVGTGGTYPNFTGNNGLFQAMNASVLTNSVVAKVISDTKEPGTHALNEFAAPYTLTINPGSANEYKIEMDTAIVIKDTMFVLKGADRVTIDGSYNGIGRYLRLINRYVDANNSGVVLCFRDNAQNNNISNCILEGAGTSGKIISFVTSANAGGSSNNQIYGCLFTSNASQATDCYRSAIVINGTTDATKRDNNILIRNNEFTQWSSFGGSVLDFNQTGIGLQIDSNKFYTSNIIAQSQILISVNNGSYGKINYNSIGGSSANRSGIALRSASSLTAITAQFDSTGYSEVQGNIISNISTIQQPGYPFPGSLLGISIVGGKVAVGTTTPNIIGGGMNSWDTIAIGVNSTGISASFLGVNNDSVTIAYNLISNIKVITRRVNLGNFTGISVGSNGLEKTVFVHHNTIRDIQSSGYTSTIGNGLCGIKYGFSNWDNDVHIHDNLIYNLQVKVDTSYAGMPPAQVTGICNYAGRWSSEYTVYNNKIYNLTARNYDGGLDTGSSAPQIYGIQVLNPGHFCRIYNNQIVLGDNIPVEARISGIYFHTFSSPGYYQRINHNSVLIKGTGLGTSQNVYSAGLMKNHTDTLDIRNNLFFNARTGGPGNYAIVQNNTGLLDSLFNYNFCAVEDTSKFARWASNGDMNYSAWKALTSSNNTLAQPTSKISAASMFPNASAGELTIVGTNRNYVAAMGKALNYAYTDFAGTPRSLSAPAIGAYEYAGVPVAVNPPVISGIAPDQGLIGSTVIITGNNFGSSASDIAVFFNGMRATVNAANNTSITVSVPLNAVHGKITVLNTANGLSANSLQDFKPMFTPEKVSLDNTHFLPKKAFAGMLNMDYTAVADLDGDGKTDVAGVSRFSDNTLTIWKNQSIPGQLKMDTVAKLTLIAKPQKIEIADLDGDKKPEIILTIPTDTAIYIIPNLSTIGTIVLGTPIRLKTHLNPFNIGIADMDGNGKPDMAVPNQLGITAYIYRNTSTPGNLSFVTQIMPLNLGSPTGILFSDMDKDAKPDMAISFPFAHKIRFYRNASNADSIRFDYVNELLTDSFPREIYGSDVNEDGRLELFVGNSSQANYPATLYTNRSANGFDFTDTLVYHFSATIRNVFYYNLDGDSLQDIAIFCGDSLHFLINRGYDKSFTFENTGAAVFKPTAGNGMRIADIDGDHKADIVYGGFNDNTGLNIRRHIYPISNNLPGTGTTLCSPNIPSPLVGSTVVNFYNRPYTYKWLKASAANGIYSPAGGADTLKDYSPGFMSATAYFKRAYYWDFHADTSVFAVINVVNLSTNVITGTQQINSGQTADTLFGNNLGVSPTVTYLWISSSDSLGTFAAASGINNLQNYIPGQVPQSTFYKRIARSGACTDTSDMIKVTVVIIGIGNNVISTNQSLCAGIKATTLTGTIPAGGTKPYQYLWISSTDNFQSSSTAAGTNNDSIYQPGTLTQTTSYKRIVLDGTYSDTSNAVTVEVKAAPRKPRIVTTPQNTVCLGTNFANFGTDTMPTADVSFTWSAINANLIAHGTTQQYALLSFPTIGTARVIVTANNGNCASFDTVAINVETEQNHVATVRYFNSNFVCEANQVNSYQWGYDERQVLKPHVIAGEINQNYHNVTPDLNNNSYWVISNKGNCYQKTYYNMPNATQELTLNSAIPVVYPNPATDKLMFEIPNGLGAAVEIQMMDIHGKVIQQFVTEKHLLEISISELSDGLYLIQFSTDGKFIGSARIVKHN